MVEVGCGCGGLRLRWGMIEVRCGVHVVEVEMGCGVHVVVVG